MALLGLAILTFLVGIGRPAIQDADEAFYAESGREMVASGDWVTPHYNNEPRTNKPILFYWLIALDYRLTGVTETGARLWSAAAGVGLVLVAAGLTRRWIGPGPDLLAGGIIATSLGLTRLARSALPDVPLALWVGLAIWAALEVGRADAGSARRRGWLWLAALAAALGFLTKGPVAWVLIALVVLPAVLWERLQAGRQAADVGLGGRDLLVAGVLLIGVTAPWFVLATLANGPSFLHSFFVGENLDRFLTDRFNVRQPVWYYLPVVAGGLLPWSPFAVLLLPPLVRALGRRTISAVGARLTIWSVAPLVFFTLSTGKQPRYILPCLVPMAILVAREAWRRESPRRDALLTAAGALTGLTLVTIAALAGRLAPILRSADPTWTPLGPALLALSGVAIVVASLALRGDAKTATWLAAAAVAALAVEATVYWPARPEPVERIAAAIAAEAPHQPVCSCNAFTRNLGFYAHVPTVVRDSEPEILAYLAATPHTLAVVDSGTLGRFEADTGRTLTRLLTVPYLDTARLRVGDVLRDPDPAKVRSIVLVRTP
jgi:4-amino-4-deoxy-L-arabinose transferase